MIPMVTAVVFTLVGASVSESVYMYTYLAYVDLYVLNTRK